MENTESVAEVSVEKDLEYDANASDSEEETLQEILESKARVGWKPDLSHLEDAVVNGTLMVGVGEKLLIEYTHLPWRDTTIWIVNAIEPGGGSPPGHVRLWDPSKMYYGATNYINGEQHGLVFKIPDKSRRWIPGEEEGLSDQVKRRRLRGAKEFIKETKPVEIGPDGKPVAKKRGRPKGSKNKTTLLKEQASSGDTEKDS